MPETSRASLCVVDIANQLCGVGEAGSHQPSPALTEAALSNKEDPGSSREILLTQLNVSLRELIDMATETQKQVRVTDISFNDAVFVMSLNEVTL